MAGADELGGTRVKLSDPIPPSNNGKGLAAATGWRRRVMVVETRRGSEPCYHLPGPNIVVVHRHPETVRSSIYGPPDAWGRRVLLVRRGSLLAAIRWALDYVARRQAEHAAKLDSTGGVC